jgi:hypothetical protein
MQHPDKHICNMRLETRMKQTSETSKTLETYACNMPLKQLQHMQHPPIYFCNVHMKQMQHTSETSETFETYICNTGGEREPSAGSTGRRGEKGRRQVVGRVSRPGRGAPPTPLQHRHATSKGSHLCSMDLAGVGERVAESADVGGSWWGGR